MTSDIIRVKELFNLDMKSIHSSFLKDDFKNLEQNVQTFLIKIKRRFNLKNNAEVIWLVLNDLDLSGPPICPVCNTNRLSFDRFSRGYKSTCSRTCNANNILKKEKSRITCLERYGVDNPKKNIDVLEKSRITCLERYGVDNPAKNKTIKDKISFSLEKYHRDVGYDVFKERIESNFYILNTKEDEFIEEDTFLNITCVLCDQTIIQESRRIQDLCCKCRYSYRFSKDEKSLVDFLLDLDLDVSENDRSVLNSKELDIYLPAYKIAIEYNGLYYHSEANAYRSLGKDYHLNKTLECQEKGIQLIHVFENEWKLKKDIVKSIIKAKLGIFDERIMARKCKIKELKQQEYNKFLDINHLQGKSITKVRLGLYHNDELVSVMGFGKSRFKRDETELIRFANKLNTSVIGGFSKLLKYFATNYNFGHIVSYCDLRYFDGSGYLKNGFEIVSRSKPNYFYWKHNSNYLYSRIQFQKHKLKDKLDIYDENLSEHENMLNNRYYRIYDCGNLKLEYKTDASFSEVLGSA